MTSVATLAERPRPRTARTAHPLRIALFAEQGHPDGTFRSGVTRLTDHIVSGCSERDIHLDFFTYHERAGTDFVGPVRYVRVEPRLAADFHGLRVDALDIVPLRNARFGEAASGHPYDVVLATSPGIGTQGQLLARRLGIPFAAIYTTDLPHYAAALAGGPLQSIPGAGVIGGLARESAWAYLAWLYGRERTDLVLVPTDAVRRDFLSRVDANAEVLGRGADTLSFPSVERAPRAVTRLLYVGRIDYGQKNLAALERVVREVEGVELVAVGDGDDLPLMRERLGDAISDGRVLLTGRVDDPGRLASLYLSADAFVFPSVFDTLGQVVLEAQRAGLPVVVRDRGGPAELVLDGHTGFVTGDDDSFVDRVRQLARDAGLRARLGRAAKSHADAMPGWADVVESLFARLESLTGRAVAA